MSILILSSTLAIIYEWRLGLVTLVFLPPMCLGMLLQLWLMMFDSAVQKTALEHSAKVAVEAISNIRTVAGLRYLTFTLIMAARKEIMRDFLFQSKNFCRWIGIGFKYCINL